MRSFTSSLVNSEPGNGIAYRIYSAGTSNEQKRGIVDQIRLPIKG
jgi:hypothetical protein